MKRILLLILLLSSFLYSKKHITVTLPIQQYFFEKIAKNNYIIHVVESRIDKFELNNTEFMNRLAFSKVYYTLGLDEEKNYVPKLQGLNSKLLIKDQTNFFKKDIVNGKENPYFWMDPLLNRKFAKIVLEEAIKDFPEQKEDFITNYEILLDEMDETYLRIKRKLDLSENQNFIVFDPYWHYFAKRFKLRIYYQDKKVIKQDEVSKLIDFAAKKDIKKLIVNIGTSHILYKSISNHINVRTVINDPKSYNWKSNIYELSKKLSR